MFSIFDCGSNPRNSVSFCPMDMITRPGNVRGLKNSLRGGGKDRLVFAKVRPGCIAYRGKVS